MRRMASSTTARGVAAIVGVGPKLGRSIARKFAHEGYTVAIIARDLKRLSRFAEEIAREEKAQVFAIRIDCSDSKSVREAFEGVLSLGFVEVLVYNAYYQPVSWNPTSFTHVKIDSFDKSLAVSSLGAFLCAQQDRINGRCFLRWWKGEEERFFSLVDRLRSMALLLSLNYVAESLP